ncbi:MAG: DUF302 domain-containing protein, partial [Rhodothalassiaceae bacterium]
VIGPYRLLGAFNPWVAHQALWAVAVIGLLGHCNGIVGVDRDGSVFVGFMDPESVLSLVERDGIEPLAKQVKARLENVMAAL